MLKVTTFLLSLMTCIVSMQQSCRATLEYVRTYTSHLDGERASSMSADYSEGGSACFYTLTKMWRGLVWLCKAGKALVRSFSVPNSQHRHSNADTDLDFNPLPTYAEATSQDDLPPTYAEATSQDDLPPTYPEAISQGGLPPTYAEAIRPQGVTAGE
jgi:hypothetical protein